MTRNTFKFGDTFWHQLRGTAMGSPPAPPYATLYYAVNEQYLLHRYKKYLLFYRRFIDDVFGIWNFDGDESMAMWLAFQTDLSFGTLHWTVNTPSHTCIFLDLSLRLEHGKIYTTLYEKELNLHLYLPPDSCHPPGVLKGLIFGAFHHVLSLTNSRPDQIDILRRLSQNLLRRGYRHKLISNLFRAAYNHYRDNPPINTETEPTHDNLPETSVILHLPYHPRDPPSKEIQRHFRHLLSLPPNSIPLANMTNHDGVPIGIDRLIIAYHRPINIRNLLFTRKLAHGSDVLAFL